MNSVSSPEEVLREQTLEYVTDKGGFVHFKAKFRATFREKFELERFPWDRQICAIKLTAELPAERVQFVPMEKQPPPTMITYEEWEFDHDMQKQCTLYVRELSKRFAGYVQYSNARVVLHLQRRPHFYLHNVILMIFLINLTSLSSFGVNLIEDFQDRLGIQVAFLFTVVMYKYLVNAWVPRKPYYTLLDYYVLLAFAFQFLAIMGSYALSHFGCFVWASDCQEYPKQADLVLHYSLAVIWILLHVMCLFLGISRLGRPSWDKVYQENKEPYYRVKRCSRGHECYEGGQKCDVCGEATVDIYKTPKTVDPSVSQESLPRQSRQLPLNKHVDARLLECLTDEERVKLQTPSAADDALLDLALEEDRSGFMSFQGISAQSPKSKSRKIPENIATIMEALHFMKIAEDASAGKPKSSLRKTLKKGRQDSCGDQLAKPKQQPVVDGEIVGNATLLTTHQPSSSRHGRNKSLVSGAKTLGCAQ
eukprot:TRINITY_DN19150_c0_g1_i3.p1 TRINITY_DN19150_c0_g1~~TRINITY_DN19150_c0_g1_i3.p1  ORF type:complete len:478 (+),score=81.26 TRINITY_DN19150_c0_g1_i3:501-1934(+)